MLIFRRIFSTWIFWFSLFSIVMLGTIVYLVLGQVTRSTTVLTQQILSRQEVIARAEAANTTLFLQKTGDSVATLAQLNSIKSRNASALHDLDVYVNQRRDTGLIGGVAVTDKHGIVQLNSNVLGTRDLGRDLSDRDFFLWAKTQGKVGEYFIGKPVISRLGGSKGQTIVVVTSPVYQNNTFTGVVSLSVILKPLLERFFGLMKVSDNTEVYLVDGYGKLLYSNTAPGATGSNISKLFSGDQDLGHRIKNALGSTKVGKFQTDKHLTTYAPVLLESQNWLLIISSPTQKIVDLTRPFYIRQIAILLLIAFTILLFGTITIKKNRV